MLLVVVEGGGSVVVVRVRVAVWMVVVIGIDGGESVAGESV